MNDADRFRLRFGPYRMPRCRVGRFLTCVISGKKKVVAISDAPIPWPMTQHDSRKGCGRPYLIVRGDLVKAIRRESEVAVAHWLGVTAQTVWQSRKALGVGRSTKGTRATLRDAIADGREMHGEAYREAIADPERSEKIAASKRGKRRPEHVIEAMRQANLGRKATAETRAKLSESARRRGLRPPAAGVPWTAEEDEAVRKLSPAEAMAKTGRSRNAVYDRRRALGLVTVGRGVRWSAEEDALLATLSITEVVATTGRTQASVEQRKFALGISIAAERFAWMQEEDELLRQVGVHEAARRLGRTLSSARNRWQELRLGERRIEK